MMKLGNKLERYRTIRGWVISILLRQIWAILCRPCTSLRCRSALQQNFGKR